MIGRILILLLIFSFIFSVYGLLYRIYDKTDALSTLKSPFTAPEFGKAEIDRWKASVSKMDQNWNGINDLFEKKLNNLSYFNILDEKLFQENVILSTTDIIDGFLGKKAINSEELSLENLKIIVHFPEGNLSSIFALFESLGGRIKFIFNSALNGFAGIIDYNNLVQFCDILNSQSVPFLVEEDSILKADLYFSSRNMNLRPYVWNTLGYSGDPQGSIAVIDSGIDDSHVFFTPGYSTGNFAYKIVGWMDEVSGLSAPYDDNGHGSHCSGIATGQGGNIIDGTGRTVSTYSYGFDYTGYKYYDQTIDMTAARFNVTQPGIVEIQCEFNDYTPGSDKVHIWVYLYHNEGIVKSYITYASTWSNTLIFNANATALGDYSFRIKLDLADYSGDGYVSSPYIRFRGEIHWPFNPPLLESGNAWKGVAPSTHLVGIKVLDAEGSGALSTIVNGINWAINNKYTFHITTISMSLGGSKGQTSLINAVNNAVNNGIVTVVAAGNDGGIENYIGSPGDADNVITVAAMSDADHVTDYSSSGGSSYTGYTTKPDIMAPGGSDYNFTIFSTDSNDNDADGLYPTDRFLNDLAPSLGTSMATPAVAGAANLVIQAMGGYSSWGYTATEAKRVKALLLMSATETYPLKREIDVSYSPQLNRGGKDVHEGYGRLNLDVALEAVTQKLSAPSTKSAYLTSSFLNSFSKHGLGGYADLVGGETYYFKLDVPTSADFDLYVYGSTPSAYGEPVLITSNISTGTGVDELFSYTPSVSGRFYLIAKAISGEGIAEVSVKSNVFAPRLTNGIVNPSLGYQSTLFNFSVNYKDLDDNAPSYINTIVNGTRFAMAKQNSSDNSYLDGCIFQNSLYLQLGNYNFQFECSDGKFVNVTGIYTGLRVNEINNFSPDLVNPKVDPKIGGSFTSFNYSVNYIDADNNPPKNISITIDNSTFAMIPTNPLDNIFIDGKLYHFVTSLGFGFHSFQIICSDGLFLNKIPVINNPEVNPFFTEGKIVINEINTGEPDFIELYNYGSDKILTNYTMQIYSKLGNKVAILNASGDSPSYWTGGWTNSYSTLYNGLTAAGINTILITNNDILKGILASVSVVILIDNVPNNAASVILKNWALAGGSVISFDSSICFLNWAGLLPPEASGTNGYGTYWDYSSPGSGIAVNSVHPIMAGYSYGQTISGTSGDAEYLSGTIAGTLAGSYYTALVKNTIGGTYDLISALNPPYAGRVVQIWDYKHWQTTSNQQLILNAVNWANSKSANVSKIVYKFPDGWTFHGKHVVVLHEGTGTDTDYDLYWKSSIPLSDGSFAVGLFDSKNHNEDWLQTSEFNASKPSDINWITDVPLSINNRYAYRTNDKDTDRASDWLVSLSGTLGALNPGQSGKSGGFISSPIPKLLLPINGTLVFSVQVNFEWETIVCPFGSVNYTLQISNKSDFLNIAFELDNIKEISVSTRASILVDFPTNTYYWRVCPSYGPFRGNWSHYSYFSWYFNAHSPIISGYPSPVNPTTTTAISFIAAYYDSDNNQPLYIDIKINGTSYALLKQNPSDDTYFDGCLYKYDINLNPGIYSCEFVCSDGKFTNTSQTFYLTVVRGSSLPTINSLTWILIIVLIFAVVASTALLVKMREHRVSPLPVNQMLDSQILTTPQKTYGKKTRIKRPDNSETESTALNLYCINCSNSFHLQNSLESQKSICPICGGQLLCLVKCTHCKNITMLTIKEYNEKKGKLLGCFYCNEEFRISVDEQQTISLEVERDLTLNFLKLNKEQYVCPKCKNEFTLKSRGPQFRHYCPFCNIPLKFILKCEKCRYLEVIDQEIVSKYVGTLIRCPSCNEKVENEKLMQLINELNSKNREIQKSAIEKLGLIADKTAESALIRTSISDEDVELRIRAIAALGRSGNRQTLDILNKIKRSDQNYEIKLNASQAIENIEKLNKEYAISITESLPSEFEIKKQQYLEIDPEFLFCSNCQKNYFMEILDAFSQYDCPDCQQPLKRILKCSNCNTKEYFGQEAFLSYITKSIKCPNCMKNDQKEIGSIEPEKSEEFTEDRIRELIINLIDGNDETRKKIAQLYQEILGKRAIPSFIGLLLYDQNSCIRAMAALSLGIIGEKGTISVLKQVIKDDQNFLVRQYAIKAMRWLKFFNGTEPQFNNLK